MTTLAGRKTKPKPTAEQLAEAVRLEEERVQRRAQKERSFQRCDTDGFVSQWAHGISADLAARQAEILRDGGHAAFPVLVDAEGNVLCDRYLTFKNRYSGGTDYKWRLDDEQAEKYGRRWVPFGCNSRVQKQLGLRQERRFFPARAKIMGSGTGLSGAATCYVGVVRI